MDGMGPTCCESDPFFEGLSQCIVLQHITFPSSAHQSWQAKTCPHKHWVTPILGVFPVVSPSVDFAAHRESLGDRHLQMLQIS